MGDDRIGMFRLPLPALACHRRASIVAPGNPLHGRIRAIVMCKGHFGCTAPSQNRDLNVAPNHAILPPHHQIPQHRFPVPIEESAHGPRASVMLASVRSGAHPQAQTAISHAAGALRASRKPLAEQPP